MTGSTWIACLYGREGGGDSVSLWERGGRGKVREGLDESEDCGNRLCQE